MKYLKEFATAAEYNAAKETLDLPNVSLIEETNGVAYEPLVIETKLVCKYNVTSTSSPTTLYSGYGSFFKNMEVDGGEQQSVETSYTFSTTGLHTVKFELNDSTKLGNNAPIFNTDTLVEVIIPSSVTSIDNWAFNNCFGLTSIVIPSSVTSIGNMAFTNCSGLTSIDIPSGVTSIGVQAFNGCTSLESIDIPNSVTSIGGSAFEACSGITSVTIPDSVTSIGSSAFYGCSGLTSVDIPSGVTIIDSDAFYNCSSLASVTVEAVTPPTLGDGLEFYGNANGRKFYVPSESVETYKSTNKWSAYESAIEAIA